MTSRLGAIRQVAQTGFDRIFVAGRVRDVLERVSPTPAAVCLMYHSVAAARVADAVDPDWHMTPETFERQMAFLAERRHVISMDSLVDTIAQGQAIVPGTVVLTFDDGYVDNLEVAAPILAKYGLPALLYLPTGYIDRRESQWIDQLHCAFSTRRSRRLELDGRSFSLDDDATRRRAYDTLRGLLMSLTPDGRRDVLRDVREQLDGDAAPALTMGWDDVRSLRAKYPLFEVGGHGAEHLDLSAASPQAALDDIAQCARTLSRELGSPARHFSFPYSRWTERTRASLPQHGFVSGVCSTSPVLDAHSDVLAMGRINPKVDLPLLDLRTHPAYLGLPAYARRL